MQHLACFELFACDSTLRVPVTIPQQLAWWCAGVSLPVVDGEDMDPLGAEQLYDASHCAQLLTHTTTIEKTHRPPSR